MADRGQLLLSLSIVTAFSGLFVTGFTQVSSDISEGRAELREVLWRIDERVRTLESALHVHGERGVTLHPPRWQPRYPDEWRPP